MIEGVKIKKIIRHKDERGFFEELIRVTDDFFSEGFAQWSHSVRKQGIIVAWHYHLTQIDWWYTARGTLQVALFDLRKNSKSQGEINEFILGEEGENIILKIPAMVAHGFKVIKGEAELFYITSKLYNPQEEGRISYNDPKISYNWDK